MTLWRDYQAGGWRGWKQQFPQEYGNAIARCPWWYPRRMWCRAWFDGWLAGNRDDTP